MLGSGIAQRTREHDLDKEEKLKRAEKYANDALEALKTAEKPNPQITDEQWEGAKKDLAANAHEALGLSAMVRKKYDVAAQEFNTAIQTASTPEAATFVRLASAYNQMNKPDEAIAVLDKINAIPEVHPQIKTAAQNERNNAVKIKGGAAKPASAQPQQTAPAQVEIKK
jgi:tetratricopeptide (TPR) repeat protein